MPSIALSGPYAGFPIDPVNMDSASWDDLAVTLRSYVRAQNISADAACETQSDGSATAASLSCGLYLVVGNNLVKDKKLYESAPFIVSLPSTSNGYWDYSPDAMPKISESMLHLTDVKVMKIWDDWWYQGKRPYSVTVRLYADGQEVDSVVLNERCSWRCEWTDLSGEKEWTVSEDYVKDYAVTVRKSGDRYLITNRYLYPSPEGFYPTPPVVLPKTGQLWWPVYALGGIGLFLMALGFVGLKLRSVQPAEGQRRPRD